MMPKGFIKPSRGFRQGNPLQEAPNIKHLLFVDYSIIFCMAEVGLNHRVQEFLQVYAQTSGQKMSIDKIAMVISHNIFKSTNRRSGCYGAAISLNKYEKYLGFPLMIGRSRKKAFQEIKTKVWQKLQTWKGKLLSQGGRKVLTKAPVFPIPTYAMSYFKFPENLCYEIETLMSRFQWGQKNDKRKIYQIDGDKLCVSKFHVGLGFKDDLQSFNLALLAKQDCHILQYENSLLHKIFKAKYFPKSYFFEAKLGTTLLMLTGAFRRLKVGCKKVSDGRLEMENQLDVGGSIGAQFSDSARVFKWKIMPNTRVSSFIESNTRGCDIDLIKAQLHPIAVGEILKMVLSSNEHSDSWI